jgi:hypothetical protein
MENKAQQKQTSHGKNADIKKEGFSAEDLGRESSYTDTTEMAQMMRRGDESIPDPNERDVVGSSDAATDTENQPFPEHQNTKQDLIKTDSDATQDNPEGDTYPYFSTGEKIHDKK